MASEDFRKQKDLQRLIEKAQDGDTEAFAKIYDEYLTPVYRYVVFRFPADLAEDVVADIFVKAWEKLHTYSPQKNVPFGAWLFRIARHTVIDAYRKTRGFDEIPENLPDLDKKNLANTRAEQGFVMRTVRKALNQLPKKHRETLLLSYVSQLNTQEIAQSLRMSEGSVRITRFRALKKLDELLPPEIEDCL